MTDINKLREGLKCCIKLQKGEPVSCEVCPYNGGRMTCESMVAILEDALAVADERGTTRWQQISPARIYECEACGQNVMTDDIAAYKYCHGCGRKVTWDG